MHSVQLLIFDLDGTLVDSSGDIVAAVHRMSRDLGLPVLPAEQIVSYVGQGSAWLVEQVLLACGADIPIEPALQRYLYLYSHNPLGATHLYAGVRETLQRLALGPWELAICTNKPETIARRVLRGLGLGDSFLALLGGDSLPQRKPDPTPLQVIMDLVDVPPEQTLMIGDSSYDILAGQAAGTWTCGVAYGFHPVYDLQQLQPNLLIERFADLLACLGLESSQTSA